MQLSTISDTGYDLTNTCLKKGRSVFGHMMGPCRSLHDSSNSILFFIL